MRIKKYSKKIGICKHRFCIYKVHPKSLVGEIPTPLTFCTQQKAKSLCSPSNEKEIDKS